MNQGSGISMTELRIEHRTIYQYHKPVVFGRHRLVLRPREGHDVRVLSMALTITPGHRLLWTRDVFGNSVAIVDFLEPADKLEFHSAVTVHRTRPFLIEEPHGPWRVPYPVTYDPLEMSIVSAYQIVSYPLDEPELRTWLKIHVPLQTLTDGEAVIFVLGKLIFQRIKYQRRSEKGVQTPAQTLRLGTGSCRDMATLMMDAARLLGLAARFASGYLHCSASEAGHASTHAWTEVYLPGLGWRGFDPTIGDATALNHVVTGVSNHPRGVMPISGMFTGDSSDYREMTVQVKTEQLDVAEKSQAINPS
jgi:transglutaminase-like putative cysteine protease